MSKQQIQEKARELFEPAIGARQSEQFIDAVDNTETMKSVHTMIALMGKK